MRVVSLTCSHTHMVEYDGGNDALFSLCKLIDSGSVMLFSRLFCDAIICFV